MPARGPEGDHPPVEGPPSAWARAALSGDLRRELLDARVRLQEASMRAEAHRLLGDEQSAAEALGDQQAILAEVEGRLARVVSAAVVQRDAEEVLAAASTTLTAPLDHEVTPAPRVPALSAMVPALVALVLVAGALIGFGRGPDTVQINEVTAGGPNAGGSDAPDLPAPAFGPLALPTAPSIPGTPRATGPSAAPTAEDPTFSEPDGPTSAADRGAAGTPGDAETEGEPQSFDTVVDALMDAVAGLDGDDEGDDTDDGDGTEEPTDEESDEDVGDVPVPDDVDVSGIDGSDVDELLGG